MGLPIKHFALLQFLEGDFQAGVRVTALSQSLEIPPQSLSRSLFGFVCVFPFKHTHSTNVILAKEQQLFYLEIV